jgi:hypothetical protein
MFRRLMMAAIVAGIAVLVGPSTSEAAFKLRLSDDNGATWTTVEDQVLLPVPDSNPTVGAVTFIGSVGAFTVNVTTGVSKPVLSSGIMDLNSINVTSVGGGTLLVELTDTDFAGPAPGYSFHVGGTTSGSASFEAGGTNSNAEFDLSNSTGPIAVSAPAFSFSSGFASGGANPFSLTIRAIITHSGPGNTSFNAELRPVPAPAGLILAATALPFVGLLRRRLRKPEATIAA